jgi:hypothetical protein
MKTTACFAFWDEAPSFISRGISGPAMRLLHTRVSTAHQMVPPDEIGDVAAD